MTEVRSSEADASRFRVRAVVVGLVVMAAFCLSGRAASPFSRSAARCGKGCDALAAGRPLLGVPWPGPRQSHKQPASGPCFQG